MKDLKDWSKDIDGLPGMEVSALENIYSEMLATAHDLKFSVPDELLVETQDPAKLREVIPPLHEALKKHHDEVKNRPVAAPKPIKTPAKAKTKTAADKPAAKEAKTRAAKKPAKTAEQKEPEQETAMTATAKKTAKTAKKTAKKGATAKGAKSAAGNARTPVGRSKFTDEQKITIKFKELPAREGSGAYDRLKNLQKFDGKTVGAFLKSELGRSSTLANCVREGWITVK
jgi:outer membrane biosynthesis protein TonB